MGSLAKKMGAKHFGVISAEGASPNSLIFYSKIKGLMENELTKIDFNTLAILRPGLLLGERITSNSEKRFFESLFIQTLPKFDFILSGPFKRFRGIDSLVVAKVLVDSCFSTDKKIRIIRVSKSL